MKIFIQTSRWGIQSTIPLHCDSAEFDPVTQVLELDQHVDHAYDQEQEGILSRFPTTVLYVLETDIMNVADCDANCAYKHVPARLEISRV